MCIAIYKPAGKILTRETLLNSYTSNRDGAGFAYVKDGEVCIQKGFFDFTKFWEAFEPFQELQCLIHFRIATHRAVNGKNCHPWRIVEDDDGQPESPDGEITTPTKGLVFIHNGMISNCSKDSDISDTGNYCKYVLQPLAEKCPDYWMEHPFRWLIEASIGKGNKLVFLNSDGEYRIFNEDQGYWDSGVWFSNKTYSGYKADFFVLKDQAEEYAAKVASGEIVVAPVVPYVSTPSRPDSTVLTEAEMNLLQQKLANEGIEVVDSLEELDKRLEDLNAAVA